MLKIETKLAKHEKDTEIYACSKYMGAPSAQNFRPVRDITLSHITYKYFIVTRKILEVCRLEFGPLQKPEFDHSEDCLGKFFKKFFFLPLLSGFCECA